LPAVTGTESASVPIWAEIDDGFSRETELLDDVVRHLELIGLRDASNAALDAKDLIRANHRLQRLEARDRALRSLGPQGAALLRHFAIGSEVEPAHIRPRLEFVAAGTESAQLFRLATMLWSVPVSAGYGRRLRILVWDDHNQKLIGLAGLTDPVFNLRARDEWVGWSTEERRERLVNVMDAHVLGAVPPYSNLLGAKLIAVLLASDEVRAEFHRRYGDAIGLISGRKKSANLTLITVTSALGRSSIYNRVHLALPTTSIHLQPVGHTSGYGHFQVSSALFARLRDLLAERDHPYANGHQFGKGPNWRMRVIRVALGELGLDPGLLRHGIAREVFVMPIATNARRILLGLDERPVYDGRSGADIAAAALRRWVVPRSLRRDDWRGVSLASIVAQMGLPTTYPLIR
jgi:hypothetical protein